MWPYSNHCYLQGNQQSPKFCPHPAGPLRQRVTSTQCPCPTGWHQELTEVGLCQVRAHEHIIHTSLKEQFISKRQKKCCYLCVAVGTTQSQFYKPQPRVFHAWL